MYFMKSMKKVKKENKTHDKSESPTPRPITPNESCNHLTIF